MPQVAIDDIFSLAPLTLRELSDLGRGPYQNQFVKGSQTNDDARTIDIQTEEVSCLNPKTRLGIKFHNCLPCRAKFVLGHSRC